MKWRPIKSAPLDEAILIYDSWNRIYVAYKYMGEWYSYPFVPYADHIDPINWMPLPKPPRKRKKVGKK